MAPSIVQRLFGTRALTGPVENGEPKALVPYEPKRLLIPETKASSLALLPRGAYGVNYTFFSPDGGRTMIDLVDGSTALAFMAYWYVATRWRAQKIAEAPLMVVHEDQVDGTEEWIPDHELVPLLDEPSLDYDMGELIEITSHHLDNTGGALWVIDRDRATRPARITPFSRNEFEIERDDTRIFATFRVQTSDGPKEYDAEEVCFFKDATAMQSWGRGKSRLDVALSWLHLGEKARRTIHDLLSNSIWPSIVISPDKDWNPDPATFAEYKDDLEAYSKQGNKGKPFVALGGASVQALSARIRDLVPEEVLNRVESVVASVTGVPAIVLQYQVGMENSPWSQMAQARRMAYDDTITPSWRKFERVITKQLLRPMDEDPTHFVRFDTSNIESLQRDQAEAVAVAVQMGRAATLNERRAVMGLEPATALQDPDKKADEIPELTQPSPMDILAGNVGANAPGNGTSGADSTNGNTDPNADDTQDDPKDKKKPKDSAAKQALRHHLERKFKAPALLVAFRNEAIPTWKIHISALLTKDAEEIAGIVETYITDALPETKSLETKARQKERAMAAVQRYLNQESRARWTKSLQPLMVQASQRGGAVIAADLNVSYSLLHPHILTFAKRTSAKMITGVSHTTKDLVSGIIQGGLDANASQREIANLIREATGFSKSRSNLIARTETTKAFNGAPEQSLAAISDATGRTFTKTWSGALDDRERDEHVAMEGETVNVGDTFSNGLDFPSEPNCRCTVLFNETE